MYEFAERTVKLYSRNKAKTEFYSQLFIASTTEAKTMSNSVRKFNELHKFMNFSWESFRWLRQKRTVARYHTRTITKKAYRISIPHF